MRQVALGASGIAASEWALGTMTFGNQTSEADALRQMDMALDHGITLWDTAEMYPVNPVRAETWGRSEAILGAWLASRRGRDRVVVATKVAGPRNALRGDKGYGGGQVRRACEESLRRLGTDRVDLLQLHWPERAHPHFRRNWTYRPDGDRAAILQGMDDVLEQLGRLVEGGLVRAVGLSNETAWGVMTWRARGRAAGLPAMGAVQNEYSLLCRHADTDMAEVLVLEGATMLSYSPLGAGLLTGKYLGGRVPPGSRKSLGGDLGGRASPRVDEAVRAYLDLAATYGIDPVHMALAWHRTRPFPSVPILGATTAAQLERSLKGLPVAIPPDLAVAIDAAHRRHPLPF
jgi:aryl-alcohol dehydrogenase-like predicted oxidoreductase